MTLCYQTEVHRFFYRPVRGVFLEDFHPHVAGVEIYVCTESLNVIQKLKINSNTVVIPLYTQHNISSMNLRL